MANRGSDTTICQTATRASSICCSTRAESTRRSPSRHALSRTIQFPQLSISRPAPPAPCSSTTAVPTKASSNPADLTTVRRSPRSSQWANSAANNGLVEISTEAMAPVVMSKPTFMVPICAVNRAPRPSSVSHSPRRGRKGVPRAQIQTTMHSVASTKRMKALHIGGNTMRPNLTATGLPPHSVCMNSASAMARSGTDSVMASSQR